jgi:hypothetical protein
MPDPEDALCGSPGRQHRQAAINWTRLQLTAAHHAVLARLAPAHREGDLLLVHASARTPFTWNDILEAASAERSLRATEKSSCAASR